MIEQVMGHRSYKWLCDQKTSRIINFSHHPNYPLTTDVVVAEFEERVETRENNISYHYPEVIRTLPKPNNSLPQLESSPHIWHFRETDTGIEFLMFSDGRRKNHFKGTSVEVMLNGREKSDKDLAEAYTQLLSYVKDCYTSAQ